MRNVRGASSGDFNPLPRKEGDHFLFCLSRTISDFNPLPRKEGDFRKRGAAIVVK